MHGVTRKIYESSLVLIRQLGSGPSRMQARQLGGKTHAMSYKSRIKSVDDRSMTAVVETRPWRNRQVIGPAARALDQWQGPRMVAVKVAAGG